MRGINPKKRAHWQQCIADWKQSGQGIKAWCKLNDIKYSTFQYWRRNLNENCNNEVSTGFIELPAKAERFTDVGIEIFAGPVCIRLQRDFDEATLGRLLVILGRGA